MFGWFVILSCCSVSGRFGSGRKQEGRRFDSGRKQERGLGRVENRREVWVGLKTGRRFGPSRNQRGGLGHVVLPTTKPFFIFFFDSTQTFCHSLRRYHRALNFTSTHGFLTEHLEQAIFLFTDTKTYHRGRLQN